MLNDEHLNDCNTDRNTFDDVFQVTAARGAQCSQNPQNLQRQRIGRAENLTHNPLTNDEKRKTPHELN